MSLFRASSGNKFKIVNGSAKVRVATSKVLYFNGAVDSDWNTLGNWWLDSNFTVHATHLPRSIDSVIASSTISINSGSQPTVVDFTLLDPDYNDYPYLNIEITVTDNATFNDSSTNYGTINGNATFNGSYNEGIINGNATFNNSSYNNTTINGNATFNDTSFNDYGTINGNATFNGSSTNTFGTVYGDATFNDNTVNSGGNITVDAVFNDSTINDGVVYGNAIFNNNSTNNGFVANIATFNDLSCNNPPGGTATTFIPDPPPSCP